MRDEDVSEAELLLQVLEEIEDLGLDGDVERRHRLIEKEQLRLQRQCPGDPDALPLPARKAVRVAVEEADIEADQPHQLAHALGAGFGRADAVDDQRLADDVKHRHARVQRAELILEYQLYVTPEPHLISSPSPHDLLD